MSARGYLRSALVGAAAVVLSAHVGSPNAFFAGEAGPYDVSVIVRPPAVVPGLAEITVRLSPAQAGSVRRVVVRPVFWTTGTRGSPAGDEAARVAGPDPIYAGQLWFMRGGSYSVYVRVEGALGAGTVTVPVGAVATAQLALTPGLKAVLAVLGFVLLVGLLTIVYRAAGESVTEPGAPVPPARRRAASMATAAAVPLLALMLLGGWRWWQGEARAYARTLYRPWAVRTTAQDAPGGRTLTLTILDSAWRRGLVTPIMPDHGKLMHMFLLREPALDVFAHLHPAMRDSSAFEGPLPPLPPGRYRVYADVVHESGFARTIVDTVTLHESSMNATRPPDPDDAWALTPAAAPLATAGDPAVKLEGKLLLRSIDAPSTFTAGTPAQLRFQLVDAAGRPQLLEPYLGMAGHAVVTRADGSVYVHLHPSGTIAMAAQEAFALRERGDTTARGRLRLARDSTAMRGASHPMTEPSGTVVFPYEFPKEGRYRIFVQVKHAGRIHTAPFEAEVAAR